MRSISIIPCYKLVNILGFIRNAKTKQIKEIAEIHVMCDMTESPPTSFPPPLSLRPQHYGISSSFYLFIFFFWWVGGGGRNFICSHCTNDKWDMGIMEAHPKVFSSLRLQ